MGKDIQTQWVNTWSKHSHEMGMVITLEILSLTLLMKFEGFESFRENEVHHQIKNEQRNILILKPFHQFFTSPKGFGSLSDWGLSSDYLERQKDE